MERTAALMGQGADTREGTSKGVAAETPQWPSSQYDWTYEEDPENA